MRVPSPRSKRRARIEIIPLIDIIFFLLATFMMVSMSMVKNQGLDVKLPVATTSSPQDRKDHVSITVTDAGMLFWDKESITLESLVSHLKELKASKPDPKIFINGDAGAKFENIVTVLDETRKVGITKVAIETTKKSDPSY